MHMVEMLTWQVWQKNDFTYLIINLWKKRRKCQFFFNVIAKCYCDHPTPLGPTALLITWHVRKMKSIIGSFVSSHESHNENMIMGGLWSSCFSIRKATRLLAKGRFFESTEMLQMNSLSRLIWKCRRSRHNIAFSIVANYCSMK